MKIKDIEVEPYTTFSVTYYPGTEDQFTKTCTFLASEGGMNLFRDSEDEFGLSDKFIATGKVKLEHIKTEEEYEDEESI